MKTKPLLLFSFAFLSASILFAQDTLYYINGIKNIAQIKQVNPNEIIYTFPNTTSSPEIILKRSEIQKIVFSGGQVLEINSKSERKSNPKSKRRAALESFHRNNIWFSISELFMFRANFTYERILGKKGSMSIRVPLSTSLKGHRALFTTNYGYNNYYTPFSLDDYSMNGEYYTLSVPSIFGNSKNDSPLNAAGFLSSAPFYFNFGYSAHTGIGTRWYVGGQRRKNFFIGFELQAGIFQYDLRKEYLTYALEYKDYSYPYQYYPPTTERKMGGMIGYFFEIGTRMNSLSNKLSFSLSLGVGNRYLINSPSKQNNGEFMPLKNIAINPQIQLSYNFGKMKSGDK